MVDKLKINEAKNNNEEINEKKICNKPWELIDPTGRGTVSVVSHSTRKTKFFHWTIIIDDE